MQLLDAGSFARIMEVEGFALLELFKHRRLNHVKSHLDW